MHNSSDSLLSGADLLRSMMPVTRHYAYFDHAAVAPLPKPAAQAVIRYAEQSQQFGDVHWPTWERQVEELRSEAAKLLNVAVAEIALVPNTTHGINLVAEGMPWVAGDNVVIPSNEFPSNMLPWLNLKRRGVEVRTVPVSEFSRGGDEQLTPDMLLPWIDNRTRLIALSWVGFASGYRVAVSDVVELAHRRGALVMLDAIQGLGAFPVDAAGCGIDFVCADGHKWMLGPEGAGILYVKSEHLNLLQPLGLGWNSLASGAFDPTSTELKHSAARYEGGTTNMAGMHGLRASLELLLDCGVNDPKIIARKILDNVGLLEEKLRSAGLETCLPSSESARSGIVGVRWPAAVEDPDQFTAARRHLLAEHIATSVRSGRLRISTHAYNNDDEIDRLAKSLSTFLER